MRTVTVVPARFTAARSGTSVATFGQRDLWDKLRLLGSHTYITNILQAAQVPTGMTLDDLVSAVTDLLLRHETLRTRYYLDAAGVLWQQLAADGELPVEVWDVAASDDPDQAGDAAERMLEATEFDLTSSWPIRVLVGTLADQPKVVMLLMSHLAADMLSARLIRQDLVSLLDAKTAGCPAPELPARRQPLDQAAFEMTAASHRARERNLPSWQRRLRLAPPTMFPPRAERVTAQRFVDAVLTSRAVTLSVRALGERYRATTAVVLMAAQAVILAHQAGLDRCALWLSVGNRVAPELAWATGSIRQHSLAVIDVSDASFADVVRRTWTTWFQAQRTGMYDPLQIKAMRRQIEVERGIALDLTCHFNDIRAAAAPPSGQEAIVRAEAIEAAVHGTTYTCMPHGPHYIKYVIQVEDEPRPGQQAGAAATLLRCYADTLIVPELRVRELLHGIERLLLWQALNPDAGLLSPAAITAATGIAGPGHDSGWVRTTGGRVELAAVRDLLRAAADDAYRAQAGEAGQEAQAWPTRPRVAVRVEFGEDGSDRLTGYVAVPAGMTPPTPEELHRRCLARLATPGASITTRPAAFDWLSAITPQHYVICSAETSGPDDALWLARPILAGSGRPVPSA